MRARAAAVALLAALSVSTALAADTAGRTPLAWKGRPMPKLTGPIFNQDCTDFFYTNEITAKVDGGAVLDSYFDVLADAGITTLMINTNARKTNYDGGVWERFWDGYDPDGPDDQPYFAHANDGSLAGYRRMIHSMMELDRQGVDYPARVTARCRLRGVSPWVSLRMNDVHYNDNLEHPFHGRLWRDPRFFRGGSGYYARGLDWAHPQVRNLYRALLVETLDRYDIDGLELDFMREPYLFAPGEEEQGAPILREWLRAARRLVYDASVRRGHPIYLGVRVPSHVEVARSWGLDAVGWAKDGLVDLIVATPRWATLEYDMPLDEWSRELEGTGVTPAGGLEILHRPLPGGPAASVSKEQAAGAAAAVLSAGADAVYLFNYFSPIASNPNWTPEGYRTTLRAMASLEALNELPRRHAITWRDITGRDENYTPPLPAEGQSLSFSLATGPQPPVGADARLELHLAQAAEARLPRATVGGLECEPVGAAPSGEGAVLATYNVPFASLSGRGHDTVAVDSEADTPVKVLGVEIAIAPAQ